MEYICLDLTRGAMRQGANVWKIIFTNEVCQKGSFIFHPGGQNYSSRK